MSQCPFIAFTVITIIIIIHNLYKFTVKTINTFYCDFINDMIYEHWRNFSPFLLFLSKIPKSKAYMV